MSFVSSLTLSKILLRMPYMVRAPGATGIVGLSRNSWRKGLGSCASLERMAVRLRLMSYSRSRRPRKMHGYGIQVIFVMRKGL